MMKRSVCFPEQYPLGRSRRRLHSQSSPDHPLGGLLENDLFLSRLLRRLLDCGLQECRLVCRKWNEVCKNLPVQLSNVPFEELGHVPQKFPNAVGVTSRSDSRHGRLVEAFYSVTHLLQLRQLELNLEHTPSIMYELLPGYFANLPQLKSLCLRNASCCAKHIHMSLKHLTSLTKLQLHSTGTRRSQVDPITELSNLQELSISRVLLTSEKGELIFPPSSTLTRLEVDIGRNPTVSLSQVSSPSSAVTVTVTCAQTIVHYAPWLQSLALRLCRVRTYRHEWNVLTTFTRLHKLTVSCMCMGDVASDVGFFPTLAKMDSLTSLSLVAGVFDKGNAWRAIAALTALKSLRMEVQDRRLLCDNSPDCPIPNLSFLSALTLIGPALTRDVSRLTDLVDLCLLDRQGHRIILGDSLVQLQRLERLVLNERYLDDFSATVFSGLTKLTSLSLAHNKHSTDGLLRYIATLPRLTEFHYAATPDHALSSDFVRQLSVLSQLSRLTLDLGQEIPLLESFADGSFPRLKHLKIHSMQLTKSAERTVFRRFPCLRSLKISSFHLD